MADGGDDQARQLAMQALTTEHTALQTARSATIFDASGRANLFLGSVSSAIVALAFVGQVSGLGTPFFVFGLVILPSLVFLGVATFARVIESSIEDTLYARGINRIRHYYVEVAPETVPLFALPTTDDLAGAMAASGMRSSPWQPFLSTAGMIEVINSVLVGVLAALLAALLGDRRLAVAVPVGLVVFGLGLAAHHRVMLVAWERDEAAMPVRFPTPAVADQHAGER